MSDLTTKFTGIEAQSAAQHTELMEALNTIAFALGAPPTVPTISLADIALLLGTINTNITVLRGADATYYASSGSLLNAINVNTDILITNSSLNAQRLLAAIYATFCECETDAPLIGPPLDVTPTVLVDEAKCRRIQFYLDLFGQWLMSVANYGAAGAAITGGTLATILAALIADAGIIAVGAEVGAVGGPPGIVIGAAVGLITVAIYTFGGAVLVDYATQFNAPTLRDEMIQAMYGANSADEGYLAFKGALIAGMDNIAAEVIYTLWWAAWSNDVYSGSPIVDDSAFDGSICMPTVIEGCIVLDVPNDTGTSSYSYEGNTYGRVQVGNLEFISRIQNTTTVFCVLPLTCSYGALLYVLPASTLITWIDLHTAIGGAFPFYIDSNVPSSGHEIEFCNLLDEEL